MSEKGDGELEIINWKEKFIVKLKRNTLNKPKRKYVYEQSWEVKSREIDVFLQTHEKTETALKGRRRRRMKT